MNVAVRMPPQAVEAEQSVLGGLMLSPESLPKISDWLAEEDFYRRDHRLIYRAILALAGQGKPVDAVTMGEWFEAQGMADDIGGSGYLIELHSTTPSAANIVAYAEIVSEKAQLRKCIEAGTELVNRGFDPAGASAGDVIAQTQATLSALCPVRSTGLLPASGGLREWFDDLRERYESGSKLTGLPYPWADLNSATHGLQPGELTIIAGRPSMGKSVVGLGVALCNAMRGTNVAMFSLEMTQRQVNRRNIAALAGIPHEWLLAPDDEHDHWPKVSESIKALKTASLLVDESAGLTIAQIAARARRAHMQKPIELLMLDHMHDVALPGKRDARFEVGEIAAMGKTLAKEFNCPAVWLAQLNRGLEGRTNKRPTMADLRESGEIEQKADVVLFLYRDDYYRRTEPGFEPTHELEVILGKGRDLPSGAPIVLREDFARMRILDWEGERINRSAPDKPAGLKAGNKF
ncbi:MAG TPA: replicative DNA helicase [Thiobacillus sp.]